MQLSRAYSLVELLVVIGIIGILTAIAMPIYNTYIIKARVLELLTVADTYKIKLIENYFTLRDASITHNLNTNVIERVSIHSIPGEHAKHVIEVVAKMQNDQQLGIGLTQALTAPGPLTIQLQGTQKDEVISWTCHVAPAYAKYVPHNCNNYELENITV